MALNVARRLVRKELKAAGIELDVDNKGLLAKVVELAKAGTEGGSKKEGDNKTDDKELAQLRKDAAKAKTLEAQVKNLQLENVVLKTAGTFNPHNPARVVAALADYEDLIDYDDETGLPTTRSVKQAITKLTKTDPYLFKTPGEGGDGEGEGEGQQGGTGFSGKTPGGAGASNTKQKQTDAEKMKVEALARMGIKQQQ